MLDEATNPPARKTPASISFLDGLVDAHVEVIEEAERPPSPAKYKEWMPELKDQLRKHLFAPDAELFKIDYFAKWAQERGVEDAAGVLNLMQDMSHTAQMRHPRLSTLDALYRTVRDMSFFPDEETARRD